MPTKKIHEKRNESKVRYPEPRTAIRPEADSGDEDPASSRAANVLVLTRAMRALLPPCHMLRQIAAQRGWILP